MFRSKIVENDNFWIAEQRTELWATTKSLYTLTNVKSEIFVRCSNSMGRNSRVPYFPKSIHSSSVSSLKAALAFSRSYRVYRLNSWTRDSKRMRDFCLAFLHPWKIHLGLFARLLNGVCRWLCNYFVNTPIGLLFPFSPFFHGRVPWSLRWRTYGFLFQWIIRTVIASSFDLVVWIWGKR